MQSKSYCPRCRSLSPPNALECPSCGKVQPAPGWPVDPLLWSRVAERFTITGILGQGAFGTVYSATHDALGGRRAVKVLHAEMNHDEAQQVRFRREAKVLYQLHSPYLVKVEDFGTLEDGRPYMIMEHAAGERLDVLVHRLGWLGELRALRIARQVLMALAEAHAAGILHRDLKAENILVASQPPIGDRVKVLDLGIARILDESARLTSDTRTLGTPEYMSPEQWRGDDLDARSDLYSLGVLVYEMLTGEVPFPRSVAGASGVYELLMEGAPEPLTRLRADLTPELASWVMGLLSVERITRPATALVALRELERVRATLG